MNESVYKLIHSYPAIIEQEVADRQMMLEYINTFDDVLTRDNRFGHFTASPWIMNEDCTKVLMVYHNIYQSWGWCGGHCDGDADFLQVALREGLEETGLDAYVSYEQAPLALDVLPVPPHFKHGAFVSSHVHLNVTYLCIGDDTKELRMKPDENSGVKWIPVDQIMDEVTEEDMKVVYAKLLNASKKYRMHV